MQRRSHKSFAATLLAVLGTAPALADPVGSSVIAGTATVAGEGTANVVVNQSTDKAIINWQTFDIGSGESTQFIQPGASSVTLNRVTGGLGASQINGALQANGNVFLINPDGILFGPQSTVDVGGLLATTNDIDDDDFLAGTYAFTKAGRDDASIVNTGTITAENGGFAALVAPGIRNSGTITATLGNIGLASANGFTLDLYGDQLLTLSVDSQTAATIKDVQTGQPLDVLVKNKGTLRANGGSVQLTAAAARKVVNSVINNTGVIEANSVGMRNGRIVLGAATAVSKPAGSPAQKVRVSGTLSASGGGADETGGKVQITGEDIALAGASIDASGTAGGGSILVGGDVGGGKPSAAVAAIAKARPETQKVANASTVTVDANTSLDVSANDKGDGGKIVVWADGQTTAQGTIAARGGAAGGAGGFVETSGKTNLAFDAAVDMSGVDKSGTLLLDPLNATIGSGGLSAAAIQAALAGGDVVVTTGTAGAETGDITVAETIGWSSANKLTLSAYRSITINDGVVIANAGAGSLALRADESGNGVGTVDILGNGRVTWAGSTGKVSVFYNPILGYTAPTNYGAFVLTNSAVTDQFAAYMLVNDVDDLQNVQQNLGGTYALGRDIDASATSAWNGGEGFSPIGNVATPFEGKINGLGKEISGLRIATSADAVGLFGVLGPDGTVDNLGLTDASILSIGSTGFSRWVGTLAGQNLGHVSHTYALTSVTAGGSFAGGLVGYNDGDISDSFSAGSIVAGPGTNVGGLVGENYSNGSILRSYSAASVRGVSGSRTGGLVGVDVGLSIDHSYASGPVIGGIGATGGLVGELGSGVIKDSYSTAAVSGIGGSLGGLIGQSDGSSAQILNSYASGPITYTGAGSGYNIYIGGLAGYWINGSVTNSYWDIDTTGFTTSVGGGTGLTTAEARSQSSYVGWDFTNDWFMIDGETRPFLRSEWSPTIRNSHQLQLMAMDLGAKYTLANDLDLEADLASLSAQYPGMWGPDGFSPIGAFGDPFTGTAQFKGELNGQGHTIAGLSITPSGPSAQDVGLFGAIGVPGIVRNLNIEANVFANSSYYTRDAGILAGWNEGSISRVNVSGSVQAKQNLATSMHVGGLVGWNFGPVDKSSSSANVTTSGLGRISAGGFAGGSTSYGDPIYSQAVGDIEESFSTGSVNAEGSQTVYAGGFIGEGGATNSYSRGNVTASAPTAYAGGFVGSGGGSQSYATGSVFSTGPEAHGFVGEYFATPFPNVYWDIDTTGLGPDFTGTALTTTQLKAQVPAGFDSAVWGIDPTINDGYPYLLWQAALPPQPPTPPSSTVFTPPFGSPPPPPPASYVQSGTASVLALADIAGHSFPWGTFFVESGTGTQYTAEQLGGTTLPQQQPPASVDVPTDPSGSQHAELNFGAPANPNGGSPAASVAAKPSLQIETTSSGTFVTNTGLWTGDNGPLSIDKLLDDTQLYLTAASLTYEFDRLHRSNWESVAVETLGFSQAEVDYYSSIGFSAYLLVYGGKHILAFTGSNDPNDWKKADYPNSLGRLIPGGVRRTQDVLQYAFAQKLAAAFLAKYPDLILTGHSLGGGMAAYAGALDGIPAVTYDASELSFANDQHPNGSMILNFRIEGDLAGSGVGLERIGTTIEFRRSLLADEAEEAAAIRASRPTTANAVGPMFAVAAIQEDLAWWHDPARFRDLASDIAADPNIAPTYVGAKWITVSR
ncbi:MAG TPA: filamentous hemagglutinin N-terminal domain-containing protein [Bauldia sp.]|nr:filamentous hemagglutinin N-terminal domain-containing protein [Bauldia sp.]